MRHVCYFQEFIATELQSLYPQAMAICRRRLQSMPSNRGLYLTNNVALTKNGLRTGHARNRIVSLPRETASYTWYFDSYEHLRPSRIYWDKPPEIAIDDAWRRLDRGSKVADAEFHKMTLSMGRPVWRDRLLRMAELPIDVMMALFTDVRTGFKYW